MCHVIYILFIFMVTCLTGKVFLGLGMGLLAVPKELREDIGMALVGCYINSKGVFHYTYKLFK